MTYQIENAFYDMRHVGNRYWIVTLHGRTVFRGLFHECMSWIDQHQLEQRIAKYDRDWNANTTDTYPNWEDRDYDTF